jgi:hypothetical protein
VEIVVARFVWAFYDWNVASALRFLEYHLYWYAKDRFSFLQKLISVFGGKWKLELLGDQRWLDGSISSTRGYRIESIDTGGGRSHRQPAGEGFAEEKIRELPISLTAGWLQTPNGHGFAADWVPGFITNYQGINRVGSW